MSEKKVTKKGQQKQAADAKAKQDAAKGKAKAPQGGSSPKTGSQVKGTKAPAKEPPAPAASTPAARATSPRAAQPAGAQPAAGQQPASKPAKKPKADKEKGSGIVKGVLSGDRIEVYVDDTTKRATWVPPQTKEIKLSNIKAPRPYAKGDWGVREEEPFAWASRNFLRELCIGKRVTWVIDGKDARREYATVHLQGEERSLAEAVVEAGYAEVSLPPSASKDAKPSGDDEGEKKERRISGALQKLVNAQDEAKKLERGKWTTSADELSKSIVKYNQEFNATEFYTREKGKKLTGIVEAALSGSMLRVLLLPSYREVVVRIGGAQAPATKRGKKEEEPEPYAKEAQWTTERYTLHRRVHLTFTAFEPGKEADQKRSAVQSIYHADVELGGKSIGELLLASGLAKFVEWTIPKEKHEQYRQLEAQAQAKKLRIWSSHTPAAQAKDSAASRSFLGLVKEVPSGSTLVVINDAVAPPQTVRVALSSIDVPKMGINDNPNEPYAWEAREFIRKKVIGRKVQVVQDYVRPAKADLPEKAFYTVSHKGKNLALALVENGLAKVVEHFGQQQRSPHYDALFLAQQRAQKKHLGVHGPASAQKKHFMNDLSRNPKKAKAIYPTLIRQGVEKLDGIVEYVISGSRCKVSLPKESVVVTVSLAGARAEPVPSAAQVKAGKAKAPSPYAEEARKFTRDLIHHHDVELEVEGQDRTGALRAHVIFKGRGTAAPINVGVEILKEGLAEPSRCTLYEEAHRKAAEAAKSTRKRIWANYDPEKVEAERKAREEAVVAAGKPRKELVLVTEVIDGSTFFVQIVGDEQKRLETLMADIAAKGYDSAEPYKPNVNEAVAAQFSGDNAWYRAKVIRAVSDNEVLVLYADYGNSETVPVSRVRKLEAEHGPQALRWQAREASLAYVRPRPVEDEWGEEAAHYLKDLVWDKTLLATIEYKEADREYMSLWISDDYTFVNAEVLRAGLAKMPKKMPRGVNKEILDFLNSALDEAYRNHAGIWEYGDDGEDEDYTF